jgi:hypothetical protein
MKFGKMEKKNGKIENKKIFLLKKMFKKIIHHSYPFHQLQMTPVSL